MTTSLLTRLSDGSGAAPRRLTPKDVSKLLSDAERALASLQGRYGPVAFKANSGDLDAAAELETLNRDIREAEDKVRGLKATLTEAERIQELEDAIARENLFHSQRKAIEAHAGICITAAEELATAETARAAAWRKLVDHSEKLIAATPVGFNALLDWPPLSKLVRLAQFETYRLGGHGLPNGTPHPASLPGYAVSSDTVNQPSAITPLAVVVRQYRDNIFANLKRRADELKSPAAD